MADTVDTTEVLNVEETIKEKEVVVEEPVVATEKSAVIEPEENSTDEHEQNGSGNGEYKENGTAKDENGTVTESGDELERKRKSIDVGDSAEVAEVVPDKKAKLDEITEGKQDEVVDSPAEQVAA